MKTPITYYGGKQRLCKQILSMIPQHKLYCEPYFGGGAVFFSKHPSKVEVINNHDERLITFYRQVVDNFDALQLKIQHTLHSEKEWLKARRLFYGNGEHKAADVSDIDIAWSVWVLCNMSYSASPNTGWKWDNEGSTPRMLQAKRDAFTENLHKRLSNVEISCRDAITVIEQRDSADTFFYLDPPYVGCQQQHYHGFKAEDFEILLTTLSMVKGKFILSHFWNEQLHQAVDKFGWNIVSIDSFLTVANNNRNTLRRKQELLIYNYNTLTLFNQ
ncbi:MAG: DNA adenine methylase [Bacteroidales bacterium]|nr:DNA adenine methylase [Bacteroidales bacterium]